ncbi:Acb2/Tad1 domain-containing protein [Nocardiopsis flavescens]
MADPQRPGAIRGYQPQSQEKIDLVNTNKLLENQVGSVLNDLAQRDDVDQDMLRRARESLQVGFMLANRAVLQPISDL